MGGDGGGLTGGAFILRMVSNKGAEIKSTELSQACVCNLQHEQHGKVCLLALCMAYCISSDVPAGS